MMTYIAEADMVMYFTTVNSYIFSYEFNIIFLKVQFPANTVGGPTCLFVPIGSGPIHAGPCISAALFSQHLNAQFMLTGLKKAQH